MTHDPESSPPSHRRLVVFRVLSGLTGLLFLGAGIANARAGWSVVTGTSGDQHPEANRWFTTVAGTSDLIMSGSFLALAVWPELTLLLFYCATAFVIAALVNLPFVPSFAVILAITVPAFATYPYWRELRSVRTWWRRPRWLLLVVSLLAAVVVLTMAVVAVSRQITRNDVAAQANWWADYAEHASLLAVASLIASSGRPGWRILAGLAGIAWTYLGCIAAFVLPDHTASWGMPLGLAAIAFGLLLAFSSAAFDTEPTPVSGPGPRPAT
jgi:hypothetical protein